MFKLSLRIGLLLIIFLTVSIYISTVFYLNHRSVVSGQLTYDTLPNPVEVNRDHYGVPHIHAKDLKSVFWAQGYVHAQDRMAEMELNRRFIQGRLSEVLGEKVINVDKQMRLLGLYEAASDSISHLSSTTFSYLKAYSDGVNAAISTHRYSLPLNLLVKDIEPWSVNDVLATGKVIGFLLANKEWRLKLGASIWGNESWSDWYPTFDQPSTIGVNDQSVMQVDYTCSKPTQKFNSLTSDLDFKKLWESGASNALALSSKLTKNNSSLLMGDPHLSPKFPDIWYTVDLKSVDHHLAGASMPGAPGVMVGRNKHLAWSFTYSFADQSQLILNPKNIKKKKHLIKIKGQKDPVEYESLVSDKGPIIAHLDGNPVALSWVVGSHKDISSEALLGLNLSSSIPSSFQSMKSFVSPSLNLVIADDKGKIGYHLVGKIPSRKCIVSGVSSPHQYVSKMMSWDKVPSAMGSKNGFLVNANNVSNPNIALNIMGYELRAKRILELLNLSDSWDAKSMKKLQLDNFESEWSLFKPYLEKISSSDLHQGDWEYFLSWNGYCDLSSKKSVIYARWLQELTKKIYGVPWRLKHPALYDFRTHRVLNVLKNKKACQSYGYQDCQHMVVDAFNNAMQQFNHDLGAIPNWSKDHVVEFAHPVFSKIPLIGKYYRVSSALPGGRSTINRAMWSTFQEDRSIMSIPSYRLIVDMGRSDFHLEYIQPLAEPEDPFGKYAFAFLPLWSKGLYLDINQPTHRHLELLPNKY